MIAPTTRRVKSTAPSSSRTLAGAAVPTLSGESSDRTFCLPHSPLGEGRTTPVGGQSARARARYGRRGRGVGGLPVVVQHPEAQAQGLGHPAKLRLGAPIHRVRRVGPVVLPL